MIFFMDLIFIPNYKQPFCRDSVFMMLTIVFHQIFLLMIKRLCCSFSNPDRFL